MSQSLNGSFTIETFIVKKTFVCIGDVNPSLRIVTIECAGANGPMLLQQLCAVVFGRDDEGWERRVMGRCQSGGCLHLRAVIAVWCIYMFCNRLEQFQQSALCAARGGRCRMWLVGWAFAFKWQSNRIRVWHFLTTLRSESERMVYWQLVGQLQFKPVTRQVSMPAVKAVSAKVPHK